MDKKCTEIDKLFDDIKRSIRQAFCFSKTGMTNDYEKIMKQELPILIQRWKYYSEKEESEKEEILKKLFETETSLSENAWLISEFVERRTFDKINSKLDKISEQIDKIQKRSILSFAKNCFRKLFGKK